MDPLRNPRKLDLVSHEYRNRNRLNDVGNNMITQLETLIYYNTVSKKWEVHYRDNPKVEFGTIVDLLTFLGKKCLVLQNETEFQFKAATEDLQRLFS